MPENGEKASNLPTTIEGWQAAGYKYKGEGRCRACNAPMLWFETPKGRNIPLDLDGAASHFATCPQRDQFKRGKQEHGH